MRASEKRAALICIVVTVLALVAVAAIVTAETRTWDDEADFASGDYESTMWDHAADGVTMTGKEAFWKYRGNPVITEGGSGFDTQMVTEPCVVFARGQYHMYYVGYDGTDYEIGLARSDDGMTYTKYASNPVLVKGFGYDVTAVREPYVIYEDGVFKMWYTGINGATESIAYATSTNGLSWTKYASNPVLSQPATGWGSNEFGDPCVVKVDGRYLMYLSGSSSLNNKLVGLATSTDGISWTYHSNNPIIQKAGTGEFGRQEICDVAVVRDGPVFRMFFSGRNTAGDEWKLGYAWSYDGYKWERFENVYIDTGTNDAFDDDELMSPCAMWANGVLMMYYHGDDGSTGSADAIGLVSWKPWILKAQGGTNPILGTGGTYDSQHLFDPCVVLSRTSDIYFMFYGCRGSTSSYPYSVALANSADPTSWGASSKVGSAPVLGPGSGGAWDDEQATSPCVLFEQGIYKMWYMGYDGSKYQIGYATSSTGTSSWTKYGSNPVLTNGSAGAWDGHSVMDPWVLNIGGTYHMWYVGKPVNLGGHYIGHATSPDGISWTRDTSNPVFEPDLLSGWEPYYVSQPMVLYENGKYTMYYSGSEKRRYDERIGVAHSMDGVSWTRDIRSPVMDMGNSTDWDDYSVAIGSILVLGNRHYVYYSGNSSTNKLIGLASFTSKEAWYTTAPLDASGLWPVEWGALEWDADLPPGTRLKFQIATSNGGSWWSFKGPDGTDATYFETSGQNINSFQSGKYLRARAFIESDDLGRFVPVIRSISVAYQQRPSPTPPQVTVTSPNGGEDWMKTKTYPITWTASGNLNSTSVSLDYSTDNGTTWTSIATRQPDKGTYKWTVPSTETSGAMVRVTVIDIDGASAMDTSDATFAIDPPAPKAGEFFAPAMGDVLAPGEHRASWVVHDPWGLAERPLTLELSVDGSVTWTLLADGLALTDSYEWEVPALATSSDRCSLRLLVLSWLGDISVIESGEFAIDVDGPTISLGPIGTLSVGKDVVIHAVIEDDLHVKEAVMYVRGTDDDYRTYPMSLYDDGTWTVSYRPERGDTSLYVSASDGVNEGLSEVVHLKVESPAATGWYTQLAGELVLAVILATVLFVAIVFIVRRRRT